MEFIVGNEKRFSEFISGLHAKSKIALISHVDVDGIASAKIINKVVDANIICFIDYKDLNDDLIKKLKKEKVAHVIFSDLNIKDREFVKSLEKFAEILIIDHHRISEDFNSEKTVFLNPLGKGFYCTAYIAYYLFSKIQNLEKLDWLVACACVADFAYFDNQEWMKKIYEKHNDAFIIKNREIKKEGPIWNMQLQLSLALIYYEKNIRFVFDALGEHFGELGDMANVAEKVQNEVNLSLKKFEKEKLKIKEGYFYEMQAKWGIKSIVATILSVKYPDKNLIIGDTDGKMYFVSARRHDKKQDMGALLEKLTQGFEQSSAGGHIPAAGARFLLKDKGEFLKRLGIVN